jgi:hypothetical protein
MSIRVYLNRLLNSWMSSNTNKKRKRKQKLKLRRKQVVKTK